MSQTLEEIHAAQKIAELDRLQRNYDLVVRENRELRRELDDVRVVLADLEQINRSQLTTIKQLRGDD